MTTTKAEQLLVSTGYDLFGVGEKEKGQIMGAMIKIVAEYASQKEPFDVFIDEWVTKKIEVDGD